MPTNGHFHATIVLLSEARFALPILARWFEQEWAPWYGDGGQGDAWSDLSQCASDADIPKAFVALGVGNSVLGTVALKEDSLGHDLGFSPSLAALLVHKTARGKGVGSLLVGAVEDYARKLGFRRIYCTTDSAVKILERRGWHTVDQQLMSLRGEVGVYCLDLGEASVEAEPST